MSATPRSTDAKARVGAQQLMGRLQDSWKHCFDWDLLPERLREVLKLFTVTVSQGVVTNIPAALTPATGIKI